MKKTAVIWLCGLIGAVSAEDILWRKAVDGMWNDPTAWNLGRVPGTGDNVQINASGTYAVTFPEGDTVLSPYQFRTEVGNGHAITLDGRSGTFLMPEVAEETYYEEPWGVNSTKGHFFNLETYNVPGSKRNAIGEWRDPRDDPPDGCRHHHPLKRAEMLSLVSVTDVRV